MASEEISTSQCCDDAADATKRRQAHPAFRRAEDKLKQECDGVDGVEYQRALPTETANQTKVRRAAIRRKIDRVVNEDHQPVHPAIKRQRNGRYQRQESYIKMACEMGGRGSVDYVPPPPLESPSQTKARRSMLRRKIDRLKATDIQGDFPQVVDVTPLLLKECGIKNGKSLYAYKRINITGEELREIADASTGVEEGLKIRRTINVSKAGPSDIFVNLTVQKSKDWIDIEDIYLIKD